jgi:hypothetical protein
VWLCVVAWEGHGTRGRSGSPRGSKSEHSWRVLIEKSINVSESIQALSLQREVRYGEYLMSLGYIYNFSPTHETLSNPACVGMGRACCFRRASLRAWPRSWPGCWRRGRRVQDSMRPDRACASRASRACGLRPCRRVPFGPSGVARRGGRARRASHLYIYLYRRLRETKLLHTDCRTGVGYLAP